MLTSGIISDDRQTGGGKVGRYRKRETKEKCRDRQKTLDDKTDGHGDRWRMNETSIWSAGHLDSCQPFLKPMDWM